MSEKKEEKLMYAIGGVSEKMLKEAEDYSENIKNGTFRKKRLKKYAKTLFAIGTAAAVIGCALLVYEKPKQSYKNDLRSTGQLIENNLDKSKADGSENERGAKAGISENIHIFNPEITKKDAKDSDGIKSSVSQDTASGYDEDTYGMKKKKMSETNDGVGAGYDGADNENTGLADGNDNSGDVTEIKADKKQRLKVYTKKDGKKEKIWFILQFGKVGDGGKYICGVKGTNVNMSIEKTMLPDKDREWKENKKSKVVCKSGTKLMFVVDITKKRQSAKDIKLSEINVKYMEKQTKLSETLYGFNMIMKKEKGRYYLYIKK